MKKTHKIILSIASILSAGALGAGNLNLEPSMFDYPILANQPIEKLEWVYRAEEVLRLEHNAMGQKYRDGALTEAQWHEYLNTSFTPKSHWLGHEHSVLRHALGYETLDVKATSTKPEQDREQVEKDRFKHSTRWNVTTDKILVPNIASASTEDFTTYTEVDPNSHITVTASKIDSSGNVTQDSAYVYKDKGVAHFSANFVHNFEYMIKSTSDAGLRQNYWAMANHIGSQNALVTASRTFFVASVGDESPNILKRIYSIDAGTQNTDTDNDILTSFDTLIYATVERDEAVGTFGTIYFRHYSDAGRTVLLDTESLAITTAKVDYEYLYGEQNDGRTQAGQVTGFTQNLDLQEAPPFSPQRPRAVINSGKMRISGKIQL